MMVDHLKLHLRSKDEHDFVLCRAGMRIYCTDILIDEWGDGDYHTVEMEFHEGENMIGTFEGIDVDGHDGQQSVLFTMEELFLGVM